MFDLVIAPRRSAKPASETRPATALAQYCEDNRVTPELVKFGAGCGSQSRDHMVPNRVRYQAVICSGIQIIGPDCPGRPT